MLALTTIALALACTSTSGEAALPTTTATTVASTGTLAPPPGTYPVLNAADPEASTKAVAAATAESKTLVDQLRQTVNLNDVEAACVVIRLDAYPALKQELGTNAQTSPRLSELTTLATDCIQATTGALNWANGLQTQFNGKLTPDQLTCLRDGYATLSRDAHTAIAKAGLDPTHADPIAANHIIAILTKCGIDPTQIPQPPN